MAGNVNKYDTHVKPYLDLIKSMRIDGHTEKDIHTVLEIGHTAWNRYKKDNKELREALKISKQTLIARLEQTLYQQALDGNSTLLIFSLKNLAPNKWADKKDDTTNNDQFLEMMATFVKKLSNDTK